jgi:hypothetical protein
VTDAPRAPDPPSLPAPWWLAARGGAVSFAWVALAASAIGILEWLAAGRPYGLHLPWKLAGLYIGAVHGAGVRATSSGLFGVGGTDGVGEVVTPTGTTLHVTFLLGTALVLFVAGRAGRRVAGRAGGGWRRRVAWGSAVAPSYALLVFAVSLVVVLRFPSAGVTDVRIVGWEALVRSFVVAALAGGAGGFLSARAALVPPSRWATRAVAWVVGGWRMVVALLVLTFAGFLVVAAVQTDASTAYVRVATGSATGEILSGHHLLLLPNQSFLMAVPAMGGCLELDGTNSQPTTLCLLDLTVDPGLGALLWPSLEDQEVRLPPVWLLFLLVPGVATLWGGRGAAAGTGSARERVLRGAGAGVVFAALAAVGVAVSAVSVTRSGQELIRLGADVGRTAVLGLAWGVTGGALGAVWLGRPQTGGVVPAAGSDADPEPGEPPPSPTSV